MVISQNDVQQSGSSLYRQSRNYQDWRIVSERHSSSSLAKELARHADLRLEICLWFKASAESDLRISCVVRSYSRRHFERGMNTSPKLSIETATQLAVLLANRPGALARVCEALGNAGVNIHALATSDTVDHTVVRMVVSDPTKALMLLGEAGVLALEP